MLLLILMVSCSEKRKQLSPADYKKWMVKHRDQLSKTERTADHIFSLTYQPAEYLWLKSAEGGKDPADLEVVRRSMSFIFTVQSSNSASNPLAAGKSSTAGFAATLNYLLQDAGRDFSLIYGSDTLSPVYYFFERAYGESPDLRFIAEFDNPLAEGMNAAHDLLFRYSDEVLHTGPVNFRFKANDLNSIPTLQ